MHSENHGPSSGGAVNLCGHVAKSKLFPLFGLLLLLMVSFSARSAEVFFNTIYKGTGGPYGIETSSISISPASLVAGSGFSFVSLNPLDARYSGNNVAGYFNYKDANGNVVSIRGVVSRPEKSGNTDEAVYFYTSDANDQPLGEAYLFVFPGFENVFTAGGAIGTSSDPVDAVLNGLLGRQVTPAITVSTTALTAFSTCAGSPSDPPQSFSVSGKDLTTGIKVTAPAGYAVSLTAAQGYSSTVTLSLPTGSTSIAPTTIYVILTASAANDAAGNIVCESAGATSASVATGTATVNPLPNATASSNSPVTYGGTLNLTASGGNTYSWSGPNGFSSNLPNPSIPTATVAASGTYAVVVTGNGGCTAVAQTDVTIIAPDTDGDGVPDYKDLDNDNDGILDAVENAACSPAAATCDTDGDGIPNYLDLDSDDDGILDVTEAGGGALDANNDGVIDGPSDANGVPQGANGGLNPPDTDGDAKQNPYDTDSDGDGIGDKIEKGTGNKPVDTDGDGNPDYIDTDSDGDGIPDAIEKGSGATPVDTDGDGKPDYLDLDSDNDGIPDAIEKGNGATPVDTDGDGTPDYLDLDSDNDGIPDATEKGSGATPVDTDGDGTPDYRDLDSDNDGIPDATEKGNGASPVDTDGDGTPDYRDLDSDNDGIPDSVEKGSGATPRDTDGDGTPDYRDLDSDGDGISDATEKGSGITPVDTDNDGKPDYIDIDSDNDGITDNDEKGSGATPVDTDNDGTPDYRDLDSDNDGISDNREGQNTYKAPAGKDTDGDGLDDAYDANNGGTVIVPVDSDNDGKPDFRDVDSDADGIPDIDEAINFNDPVDTDGDGKPDYRDVDSNNDSIPDGETLLIYKTASVGKLLSDGTFNVNFTIRLKNNRNVPLTNVAVKDDLTATFKSPVSFKLNGFTVSGSTLLKNASYDGKTTVDLLASGSTLGGNAADSIVIQMNVNPSGYSGDLFNTGRGTATSKWGPVSRESIDPSRSQVLYGPGTPTRFTLPGVNLFIADVLTPNGDGYNDKWVIVKPGNYEVAVIVYNRWGQEVYKNSRYNNEWDGKGTGNFLGKDLPNGTYFYIVEITDKTAASANRDVRKGSLTLKRSN